MRCKWDGVKQMDIIFLILGRGREISQARSHFANGHYGVTTGIWLAK